MNAQNFLSMADRFDTNDDNRPTFAAACDRQRMDTDRALSSARNRLLATAALCQQHKAITNNGKYYGVPKANSEEVVCRSASAGVVNAIITRNHYGSLVLNASRTLFIDVDGDDLGMQQHVDAALRNTGESWQGMFNDLCVVLQNESNEGFRIYRTAAGFRLLATTHEYQPGSLQSNRLMQTVGADAAFVELCRIQQNFRARLSPKPWRCGTKLPPNSYPRKSIVQQQTFAHWRSQYDRACCQRATCKYLGHIGPSDLHECIAPIIELHDRETKAFESLPLA